jgi:nickel superoxide dismutase
MKKISVLLIIYTVAIGNLVSAHCQIPCGIYGDALKIIQIKQDYKTIKKAMNQIVILSSKQTPLSSNQLTRWITIKEKHGSDIQEVFSNYFLTQRINEKNKKYVPQTLTAQKILVNAMKCKQNIESNFVSDGLKLVDTFSNYYFDSHGLEHLKKLSD